MPSTDQEYELLLVKARARRAVHRAIKSGRLIRKPCWVCGSERVEAHHPEGYDKPLVVEWLCRTHHRAAHSEPLPTEGWDLNHGGSKAARLTNTLSSRYPRSINTLDESD